jgi:hypothetical protein
MKAAMRKLGNGPWRILEDCEAGAHNTLSAARGDTRRTGGSPILCVCPQGAKLLRQYQAKSQLRKRAIREGDGKVNLDCSRRQMEARRRKNPMLEIGGGPWAIHPDCPTELHNTLRAARGHVIVNGRYIKEKCICPRARDLYAQYRAQQVARNHVARLGQKVEDGRKPGARMAPIAVVLAGMPDLSAGRCVGNQRAQEIFDAASASTDDDGAKIDRAKSICAMCPKPTKRACADWALKGERTPGDWSGVYGGLSPRDRIQLRYGVRTGARV